MKRITTLIPRRRKTTRLGCEPLEGRALMATSALDPAFGTGGTVLGPLVNPGGSSNVAALRVLSSGQIVTAETQVPTGAAGGATVPLVVRRYDADGTLDTTFGTGGTTTIPFPSTGLVITKQPRNLAIQDDGSIVLAVAAAQSTTTGLGLPGTGAPVGVVARLTPTGQLDTTFDGDGTLVLPSSITQADSVVVEPGSGRIVVAGVLDLRGTDGTLQSRGAALVGLTSTGAIDSTFGNTGLVTIPGATGIPLSSPSSLSLATAGLQITPTGQILLGVYEINFTSGGPLNSRATTLTRLNGNGTIDATFGTGGTLNTTNTIELNDLAVQADGKIVLAGAAVQYLLGGLGYNSSGAVVRLLADGTPDPSFTTVPTASSSGVGSFTRVVVGTDGAITALDNGSRAYRYLASGQPDTGVGVGGRLGFRLPAFPQFSQIQNPAMELNEALGLAAGGSIVIGGGSFGSYIAPESSNLTFFSQSFLAQLRLVPLQNTANDYDGDGRSDLAATIPAFGVYGYRPSGGNYSNTDTLIPVGGDSATANPADIPAPGDYDGDGRADAALYDPATGSFIFTPLSASFTSPNRTVIPFGVPGIGESIPAPGDYDGDGKTDLAVYLPALAAFGIRPSSGGPDRLISFGVTGRGNAIPAPGDYDGDGKTDLAVYLPSLAVLAYRPSSGDGTRDVYIAFGAPGAGESLPAPGDYDGDGKTDVAVYLPAIATYAYRSSAGKGDVLQSFGVVGAGAVTPVPGDYDGDGTDDIAVYIPEIATWVYRSSAGKGDVAQGFGSAGAGNSVPATVVVPADAPVSALSLRGSAAPDPDAGVLVYLPTDDLPGTLKPRKNPVS